MSARPRTPYPSSDHWDGKRFFNPGVNTDKSLAEIVGWQRARQRTPWPDRVIDPPAPPPPTSVGPDQMALTFIGHSTYLIRTPAGTILTDPVFSERASPLSFAGPKRARAPGIALDQLPRIDVVLLSHNHYDHLDLATLRALQARFKPTIVTGLGNGAYLDRKNIHGAIECDWWDTSTPKPGMAVTYVPAQHWSSRTMFDRRRMLWGGHVVETEAGSIYFAGDTGAFDGFRAIRERCGPPDVALLPIGAYEPRWFMKTQHMNPEEAVEAHETLGAGMSLATHWGTFQLTDEGIDAPLQALDSAMKARSLDPAAFLAPVPGETISWCRPDDARFP